MIRSLGELVQRGVEPGPARIVVVQEFDPDVLESLVEAERTGLARSFVAVRGREAVARMSVGSRGESTTSSFGLLD